MASFADDRAEIEDLQARYMFAMDFRDADRLAGPGQLRWHLRAGRRAGLGGRHRARARGDP